MMPEKPEYEGKAENALASASRRASNQGDTQALAIAGIGWALLAVAKAISEAVGRTEA